MSKVSDVLVVLPLSEFITACWLRNGVFCTS